jgi:hypothetical protein
MLAQNAPERFLREPHLSVERRPPDIPGEYREALKHDAYPSPTASPKIKPLPLLPALALAIGLAAAAPAWAEGGGAMDQSGRQMLREVCQLLGTSCPQWMRETTVATRPAGDDRQVIAEGKAGRRRHGRIKPPPPP